MCSFLSGKGPNYRSFCVRLSPEITLAEEKERKNTLLGLILETFLNEKKKKNCHTERVLLAVKFSKIHLDM